MTQEEAVRIALQALRDAISKYRIDFDAYWRWYDGERVAAINALEEVQNARNDKSPA